MLKFFRWAYKSGGQMATALDYVPLPAKVVTQVEDEWKTITKDGKPVLSN